MSRKYVGGTKQTSKKKKVKTATIQEADEDPDGEGSDETASNETNREAKIPTVKETFDPDIFWYGGTQGVMKLTAGQCPALLAAIGKEIRDLWHGFKTFSSTKKLVFTNDPNKKYLLANGQRSFYQRELDYLASEKYGYSFKQIADNLWEAVR